MHLLNSLGWKLKPTLKAGKMSNPDHASHSNYIMTVFNISIDVI